MDSEQLAELERRTYRAAYDDGLWDILLGVHLVVLGIGISAGLGPRNGWLGGLTGGLAFPVWLLLRKTITEPRVGYVRLHPTRIAKLRRRPFVVFALMLLILALGVWVSQGFGSLVYSVPFAAAGYLFEVRRFYLYAGLIALERALDSASGTPHDWMYWPSGLVMVGSGLLVLASFLRRYPAKPKGVGADA